MQEQKSLQAKHKEMWVSWSVFILQISMLIEGQLLSLSSNFSRLALGKETLGSRLPGESLGGL